MSNEIQPADPVRIMLDSLSERGFSSAHIERALELPQRTLESWKSGSYKAEDLALLKMVHAFPWLLEVAECGYLTGAATIGCDHTLEAIRVSRDPHPLNDAEVQAMTVWETPAEVPAFLAGWCHHRDNREKGIPEYGPHAWGQNERVAFQRGAMAAKAAHDACGGTVEQRAELQRATDEAAAASEKRKLAMAEAEEAIAARFPEAVVSDSASGSEKIVVLGGSTYALETDGELYRVRLPGEYNWGPYWTLTEALDTIATASWGTTGPQWEREAAKRELRATETIDSPLVIVAQSRFRQAAVTEFAETGSSNVTKKGVEIRNGQAVYRLWQKQETLPYWVRFAFGDEALPYFTRTDALDAIGRAMGEAPKEESREAPAGPVYSSPIGERMQLQRNISLADLEAINAKLDRLLKLQQEADANTRLRWAEDELAKLRRAEKRSGTVDVLALANDALERTLAERDDANREVAKLSGQLARVQVEFAGAHESSKQLERERDSIIDRYNRALGALGRAGFSFEDDGWREPAEAEANRQAAEFLRSEGYVFKASNGPRGQWEKTADHGFKVGDPVWFMNGSKPTNGVVVARETVAVRWCEAQDEDVIEFKPSELSHRDEPAEGSLSPVSPEDKSHEVAVHSAVPERERATGIDAARTEHVPLWVPRDITAEEVAAGWAVDKTGNLQGVPSNWLRVSMFPDVGWMSPETHRKDYPSPDDADESKPSLAIARLAEDLARQQQFGPHLSVGPQQLNDATRLWLDQAFDAEGRRRG